MLEEVSDEPVSIPQARSYTPNRKEARFAQLLSLAVTFIEKLPPDVRGGTDGAGRGYLWRMWQVYESYVRNALAGAQGHDPSLRLHPRYRLVGQEQGQHLIREPARMFGLTPDLVIYLGDEPVMVCDTKWKQLDWVDAASAKTREQAEDARRLGVAQGDLYQMFAYSRYYGALRRDRRPVPVTLIYPMPGATRFQPSPTDDSPLAFLPERARWEMGPAGSTARLSIRSFPVPVQ